MKYDLTRSTAVRRFIIQASLIGWLAIFSLTIGLPENLLMFVLFGMVPGTDIVLGPLEMQRFWFVVVMLLVGYVNRTRLLNLLVGLRHVHMSSDGTTASAQS
ncbi:MAG TPA: hypothetical protein PK096_04165 [Candidatus Saccharibacteria bacterium]|nr:hypothetical protein [Candidatus Saccharibacteria bacterium]HRK94537.1 hypothetical protein [Candidatus Saccharibacteria bacterium]